MIWQERRISRAEIARRSGLSRSTVSEIVSGLLATGLVAEIGEGQSSGGRRPIVLEFRDDASYILGVDIGAAHVAVALTDLRGKVLVWASEDHPVREDPAGTAELVERLCEICLKAASDPNRPLLGIGVAVPSPVDPRNPDQPSEVVLPNWKGFTWLGDLPRKYGVPSFVDNDANLGALAERWWGAGRGIEDFAYIKVATGVGAGHVIHGEIYRGATGVAGEIGHMAIDPQGLTCVCGLRGCLVTLIGTPALVRRAESLLEDFPDSVLQGKSVTMEALEEAAMAHDPLGRKVVAEAAENLGIAVAGMLNLMNPAAVIIGGGLARVGDRLLDPLRETVLTHTLESSLAAAEIMASELGPRSVAIGAATLVLDAALEDPGLFPTAVEVGAQ
jgi:predicted NBD/HSP70 family sugar kinase